MFHWRQQPLVTIIITIIAKGLMRIVLLHLQRKSLVALSNSNV
jgi:hypothetical protein